MIGPPDPLDPLEDEFPLGDGVADLDAEVICPYCGEGSTIALDPGGGEAQDYVEDCQICCQPLQISVRYGPDGTANVWVEAVG